MTFDEAVAAVNSIADDMLAGYVLLPGRGLVDLCAAAQLLWDKRKQTDEWIGEVSRFMLKTSAAGSLRWIGEPEYDAVFEQADVRRELMFEKHRIERRHSA